jgi:trimeric autotransporter adhesin
MLTITIQPVSQTSVAGSNVAFSVAVNGTGPFTYQWQLNGTNLPNTLIKTLAGSGVATNTGDGGVATNAGLYNPVSMVMDACGNMYIADSVNYRIRKVDANGNISTFAGNGTGTFAGDGGVATNASLFFPSGVALDANRNLLIADALNNRIRKVDANGVITTVAGNGTAAYAGDDGAATNASLNRPSGLAVDGVGNFYICDGYNNRIRRVDTNGIISTVAGNGIATYAGDGASATNASLYHPRGVALDVSGNLFVADSSNHRIRIVDTNGIISTFAGNGSGKFAGDGGLATNASLYDPFDVGFDVYGNLFIADTSNNRIRIVDANGIIATVAGNGMHTYAGDGGNPTNASLYAPMGVATDALGNLLIADQQNQRVRMVYLYASHPTLVFNPVGAVNAGNYSVVVTGPYNSITSSIATLTVQASPTITVQPQSRSVVLTSNATFSVSAAGSGVLGYWWYFAGTNLLQNGTNATLTVANISNNSAGDYTVVATNIYGSTTSQVATLTVLFPPSVVFQPVSQTNLVGTAVNYSVTASGTGPLSYQWQFNGTNFPRDFIVTVAGDTSAGYTGDGGPAYTAPLDTPVGVALDAAGNLYIVEHSRIRKVDTNGIITSVAGNGGWTYSGDGGVATNASLKSPSGVAADVFGNIYIADQANNRVRKVDTNGIITTVAGNGISKFSGDNAAAINASLGFPFGVVADVFGNIYIADQYNNRIRKVDANGIITTMAGSGGTGYYGDGGRATNAYLYNPTGVALDSAGNLYIADQSNNRIRKVSTNGVITTVAGNGGWLFAGDNCAATNASLYHPPGVALDSVGNLYIADQYYKRIRKVLFNFGQSSNLTLSYLSVTNSGRYSVIISNSYGSVTSVWAGLSVYFPQPQIATGDAGFGILTNQFGFNIIGIIGQNIVVDGSTDLINWVPVFTNASRGGAVHFSDSDSTNYPQRYYRARTP